VRAAISASFNLPAGGIFARPSYCTAEVSLEATAFAPVADERSIPAHRRFSRVARMALGHEQRAHASLEKLHPRLGAQRRSDREKQTPRRQCALHSILFDAEFGNQIRRAFSPRIMRRSESFERQRLAEQGADFRRS
jgi:hypothetical protein